MKQLVKIAIELELRGQGFYEQMARTTDNELARALFNNLAADETDHAERIRELGRAAQSDCTEESSVTSRTPIEQRIRDVFARLDQPRDPAAAETVQALETAMKLEQETIDLYHDLADQSPAPCEAKFLEQLLAEEWEHLEALRNVHLYMTRTGDWFDEEESKRWNWMNI